MKHQTESKHIDHTLGFPVVIWNAPKVEYDDRDMEALDISPRNLTRRVIRDLVATPRPWTGDEVQGVRKWLRDTLRELADRLGVSHVAVSKWQDAGDAATHMSKGSEYMLRMEAARRLLDADAIDDHEFVELSARAASFDPNLDPEPIELDGRDLADDDRPDDSPDRNAAAR
jgi:DNA-binding transcriptional regulator YiaG